MLRYGAPLSDLQSNYHRCLLLKLDTQPHRYLVVEVCIKQAYVWHPPLHALCLVCCQNRPVDGDTDLLV